MTSPYVITPTSPQKPLRGHTALRIETESFPCPAGPHRIWPLPTLPAPSVHVLPPSLQPHQFSLGPLHSVCSFSPQDLCRSCVLYLKCPFQPSFRPFTYLTPAYSSSLNPDGTSSRKRSLTHPRTRLSEGASHPPVHSSLLVGAHLRDYPSPWGQGQLPMPAPLKPQHNVWLSDTL